VGYKKLWIKNFLKILDMMCAKGESKTFRDEFIWNK